MKILLFILSLLFINTTYAANTVHKLTLAQTWSENTPILSDVTRQFAKLAYDMSDGRLQIRIDSANKHKAPFGIFDLVRTAQYDLGHSASYYWKGKDINTLYFTTMPFGMTTPEQYAWFVYGGGQELMDKVYNKYGIKSIPGGNTGNQMGGWFKKEINSLKDLQGLKIRITGFAAEIMAKVGAKPVNIAPAELYSALDRKTIDAVEWISPVFDLKMGFNKIAPFYYTGWHEPAGEAQFLINNKKFATLPNDLQNILIAAMRLSAYDGYAHSTYENAQSLQIIQQNSNITIKHFPKPVLKALKKANDELLLEQANKNKLSKKIINSQLKFLKKVRAWTKISDQTYLENTEGL